MSKTLSSLPALLAARAASEPSDPWLFQRELLDWRWRPWGRVAEHAAATAGLLRDLPQGCRIAFDARPSADAVTLDLAIQAAGRVAVPVRGESVEAVCAAAERLGCQAWLGIGPQPIAAASKLEPISASPVRSRLEPWAKQNRPELPEGRGPVVLEGGREMSQEALIAAARRLGELIHPGRGRAIALAGFSLEHAEGRVFAAWTLLAGAALLLEPFPEALLPGLLWTRPTVVHGSAETLAGIARAHDDRRQRRASRLRTFLLSGDEQPEPRDVEALENAGAAVLQLPAEQQVPR